MNQQTFEAQNRERWQTIDQITAELLKKRSTANAAKLPALFRQLCADIALAQHRMYGARLCAELNARLIRCRQAMGTEMAKRGRGFTRLFLRDFPRAVRRDARLFWLAMLLLIGPMILMVLASKFEPRWIFSVLGPDETQRMDYMYGKDDPTEFMRSEFGSDFGMFGFYVYNNISIGLRIAGMGLLAMVGSMFALGYQGVVLGASEGYVHYAGNTERFYAFVAGHSALELIGIVICGMAGMRLGQAILKPGRETRGAALATAGRRALPLIYGGALLIFFAAFVEGFWSAGPASTEVKYAVGIANAIALAAYLLLCGRNGEESDET